MNDQTEIAGVLQKYFQGLFRSDVNLLREAFHPSARVFGEVRGKPYEYDMESFLAATAKRKSPHERGESFEMEALNVEIVNNVAQVKARCPMTGLVYLDFLALARADSGWRITNKLFTSIDAA